jgi:dihydroorotate dehydrogenase
MLYSLARPMLFSLSPERAHELTLSLLKSAHKIGLARQHIAPKPVTCMGIEFPNPVGLQQVWIKMALILMHWQLWVWFY